MIRQLLPALVILAVCSKCIAQDTATRYEYAILTTYNWILTDGNGKAESYKRYVYLCDDDENRSDCWNRNMAHVLNVLDAFGYELCSVDERFQKIYLKRKRK